MLDSLDIKNYRNLDELKIDSLSKVNLITGKNNTGKSTLLEAIAIYTTKCDLSTIYQLLEERGEILKSGSNNNNIVDTNIKIFSSFFYNRVISFDQQDSINIGVIESTLFGKDSSTEKSISIRFVKYIEDINEQNDDIITRRRVIINVDDQKFLVEYKIGIEIRVGNSSYILPLDKESFLRRYRFGEINSSVNFQYIRTRNIDRDINGKLWDNITLTEKEKFVIEALQIIEPKVERIAFIEEGRNTRSAVIKLLDNNNVFPLRSMGDGIYRILTIILALVNSDNGYLLIDEFENGLHHSTQKKLWKIIFVLAKKLNVQIFATTHSEDCIFGFEQILNSPQNTVDGKLIRLDTINGKVKQIEFSKEELKIATDQNLETR